MVTDIRQFIIIRIVYLPIDFMEFFLLAITKSQQTLEWRKTCLHINYFLFKDVGLS